MKKRELVTKILAGLLVAGMLIGLLPMFVSAEESTGSTEESQGELVLNKNAVLQADGTWTITLEAYATGTVKTEVRTQVIPTDIIMVLDQSGSMTQSGNNIQMSNGTYSVVTNLPTNEAMTKGTYYYWDANDQKYYPITTTRHIVHENSYWAYAEDFDGHTAGELICLASEASGTIGTSWTYGGHTVNFDAGEGYLLSDYRLYLREQTGSWTNRTYNYKLVSKSSNVPENVGTYAFDTYIRNANTAYNTLADKFSKYQTDSATAWTGTYAFVYVPVELVNDDVYYYTYTYVDDMGQTWTIGHSEQDDGATENIADAKYDATKLGNIYTENVGNVSRLNALKSAANTFIRDMNAAAISHNVDHRVAVIGFASTDSRNSDTHYGNTEVFVGGSSYNYSSTGLNATYNGSSASDYYSDGFLKGGAGSVYEMAWQSVGTDAGRNNLNASISNLAGNGATFPSHGFEMAIEMAKLNAEAYANNTRKLVVVFMTDGEPGRYEFDDDVASTTVGLANTLKNTYGAKFYTVAMLDSAPSEDTDTEIDDEDDFLDAVTNQVTSSGTSYYSYVNSGVDLSNFFTSIEISVDTSFSTVELSKNAFLVDRVSEYFEMPAGITTENMKDYVKIYTAEHIGSHMFKLPVEVEYEVAASVDHEDTLNAEKIHAWLTYGAADNKVHGITVHNFNYLANDNVVTTQYWAYEDSNANGEYDEGEKLIPIEQAGTDADSVMISSGKKIIIEISGITAKDNAALDYYIETNNDHSGLWDLAKDTGTYGMLKAFPMPRAMLGNRIYVLDYAKEACLATLDHTRKALALDSAKDGVMNPVDIHDEASKKLSTTDANPAVQFGDVYIKEEGGRSKVYYTPKTTNWYGYDTFYVFWQGGNEYDSSGNLVWSEGDPVTGYCWSKVNVMPANNVYYEDTFVTTSTDGTTETGRVGIDFGTGWSFTTVDSNGDPAEGSNTESPESAGQEATTGTHGWVESLADDTGFTDGTVAVGDGTQKAKATFTFTGTGVDLYSYTDSKVGTVMVKVKPIDVREGYNVPTRYFIVDNYSASGDYYSIPTVSYLARGTDAEGNEALVYGKYEVTITVTTAAIEDGGRVTYYLDGIRVYNPLGSEQENNPTVGEGYGDEVHAFFYNIRDYLIGQEDFLANSTNPGAVFIDEIKEGQVEGEDEGKGVTTTVIGTYKDYGPKNEVYLAENQMIVMKVDILAGRKYFVSLKAPTGAATTAEISSANDAKATVPVGHTADLYYEVVPTADANDPSVGYIAIKNVGTELLSVTKFQITGLDPNPTDDENLGEGTESGGASGAETASILSISNDEAVTYARTFALMRSVPYVPSDNESETENNTEEQVPVEPEVPEIEITNPEVDPEPETPDEPSAEEQAMAMVKALVDKLFKSVIEWFNA